MRQSAEGFKSETVRAALSAAVAGKPASLEDLLCRHGGGPDPRPNLRLAAAFGEELRALPQPPVRLLARFGADDAAPDEPRVFLPIAAAHGWAALLLDDRDNAGAWSALGELAADERTPVRMGIRAALAGVALQNGIALALVRNALDWFDTQDAEDRFGAAALVVEVLADRRVVSLLAGRSELLDYLGRAIHEVAHAPRSSERLDGRRRLLLSFPATLATVVAALAPGDRGPLWFEAQCEGAHHPDVRKAFSETILRLRKATVAQGSAMIERLRQKLEGSAKPPRDPTRKRPGHGRGKSSRAVR